MSQSRLLMLTHRFPYPPNRGDRIRSYHLLQELSQEFRVTLAAITDEPVAEAHRAHVQDLCEQVLVDRLSKTKRLLAVANSASRRTSLTAGAFASARLSRQINRLHQGQPFDAVLVYCSSMFPYVDQAIFQGVPVVVDLVDVDSSKWQQMGREARFPKNRVFRRESHRVRQLEQRIADTADAITLVSDNEAALYHQTIRVPKSQTVRGVSNGVDAAYFQPPAPTNWQDRLPRPTPLVRAASQTYREFGSTELRPEVNTTSATLVQLVFTGVLDYHPNVAGLQWFCREVLPGLQNQIDVAFKIVGRSPHTQVQSLDALDGVEVVGEVPDVRPYLAAADIAISPLQLARGIQNKVLEAMAMGRPVVCTSQSAQGIAGEDGAHFIIADTVSQWQAGIMALAQNEHLRELLGRQARQLVVAEYSWPARLEGLVSLVKNACL